MDYISHEAMRAHVAHARAERARCISTAFARAFSVLLKTVAASGRGLARLAADAGAFRHTHRGLKPGDGEPA
jgi:hypothetical protein